MLLSNKETTHEKSGIDTLMCFPARGSFFDLHFNQEQDSPRVPRPISGASPSKKAAPSYRRKAVCGRVVVSDSKFSVKSALYRHSRESGNPGPRELDATLDPRLRGGDETGPSQPRRMTIAEAVDGLAQPRLALTSTFLTWRQPPSR